MSPTPSKYKHPAQTCSVPNNGRSQHAGNDNVNVLVKTTRNKFPNEGIANIKDIRNELKNRSCAKYMIPTLHQSLCYSLK